MSLTVDRPRITLREPQARAKRAAYALWRRDPTAALLVVLPTGVGKTIVALSIMGEVIEKWKADGNPSRIVWLAHRSELLTQTLRVWRTLFPDLADEAGIYNGDDKSGRDKRVVFASVQTMSGIYGPGNRAAILQHGEQLGLIVVDEAHHAPSDSYLDALEGLSELSDPKPKVLGLTATPERADRKQLGEMFELAYAYTLPEAIKDGHLVDFEHLVCRIPAENLDTLEDMDDPDLRDEILLGEVVAHSAGAVRAHGADRRGILFTASVVQAERTARALCGVGVPALAVHGALPRPERARRLEAHRHGEVAWLTNCNILTEGYDDPSVDCVFVARPMRSKPLYVQAVGRGLRLAPGKTHCLIIDIAGASDEHDLIQAPALLRGDDSDEHEREAEVEIERQTRSLYKGLLDPRERSSWQWIAIPDKAGVFVCGMGRHGIAALLEVQRGGWQVYHLPPTVRRNEDGTWPERAPVRALLAEPADMGLAMAIGEDLIRRSGAGTIAGKAQPWRELPPKHAQVQQLQRKGLPIPPTRGRASDLLTIEQARRDLRRLLRRRA